jgi:TPR repeat protein
MLLNRRNVSLSGAALTVWLLGAGPFFLSDLYAEPAGECRAALRPLMLQQNPDASQIPAIRELCHREADAGDPEAIYQLAFFFLGLESWDPGQATSLILTAAEHEVPEAQYWLAWQYDSGPLLPNDPHLALRWYQAAADKDHRLALERLAEAYTAGDFGLPVDRKKASELKARAARCADSSG